MGDSNAPKKDSTSSLWMDLSKFQGSGDWEKCVKICNKILNLSPDDFLGFRCKLVALIQDEKFKETLQQINNPANSKFKSQVDAEMAFETAYCHYRDNDPSLALNILKKSSKGSSSFVLKEKELEAQILYRLERYEECFNVYREIVKNTSMDDDFQSERLTNMSAAAVHYSKSNFDTGSSAEDSYELTYNHACALLAQGKWLEAENALKKAQEMAEALIKEEEEEADVEDIDRECGIIRVQLGFALQMQGKEREAQTLYNNVLKSKPTDIGLIAVASNNLLTLNKDQNIFDSRKRIKAATAEGLESKLTSSHRRQIARNNALLAMYTNQVSACQELVEEMAQKFEVGDDDDKDLILAGVLSRSGKTDEALSILLKKSSDLERVLIASQILLESKNVNKAVELMEKNLKKEDKFRTGVLSMLVTLYLAADRRDKAASLLKDAVDYNNKNKGGSGDMGVVWRKTAEFHLKGGEPAVAAKSLEELLKGNPKDRNTLAQLVLAYAKFDLAKALEVSKKLPEFKSSGNFDIEALESTAFLGGGKKTPKVGGMASPKAGGEGADLLEKKKKKKSKKKKKLPKNYNPNVEPDPERWLPKKERTGYRRNKRDRRNKNEKFTGAQGTSQGQSEVFDYSSKKASSNAPKSPNVTANPQPGPRQTNRKPKPKNKKKSSKF